LEHSKTKHIILFGSAAPREMTTASDLDVVVIVDNQDQVKETQKAFNQLSRLISWPVDCLVIDQDLFEKWPELGGLYAVVKDEGVFLSTTAHP
jgi:predicted nucleotidyltransferase